MKQLTCEMCGSIDLIKQEGVFVCQICGTKYSVEEAKKMMLEESVNVTRTVKVDNSERIKNVIVNAKRAFADGKYQQAQVLFSQVLGEEPNNVQAILYEGLAIGWQGNAVRYTMDKAGNAANRAVEIVYEAKVCIQEYEVFVLEAATGILSLGLALVNLCYNSIDEIVKRYSKQTEELIRHSKNLSFGMSALYIDDIKRQHERDEKYCMEQKEKFEKISDNTILIVLSVYEKIASQLKENSDVIGVNTYEALIDSIVTVKDKAFYMVTVNKVDKLIAALKKYENEKEKKFQAEKRKRIDKYWIKHKDKKIALITEQESLTTEILALDTQINEYYKKINEFNRQKSEKIDAERIYDAQCGVIEELEKQKEKLGFFKGKEKKKIQERIEKEKEKLSLMKEQAEKEGIVYRKEIDQQINVLSIQKSKLKKTRNNLKKRFSIIEKELTKDREEL